MYYIQVPTIVGLDKAPSPNGKATDSDSVIFKVRILVALLKELTGQFLFLLLRKSVVRTQRRQYEGMVPE